MGEPPRRHCWECLRRCLVCDSTRPGCRRCSAAGTACPGYGDVKPTRLRWLAPGQVSSRRRRNLETTETTSLAERREQSKCARTQPANRSGHVAIPRFEFTTVACALAQAANYCQLPLGPQKTLNLGGFIHLLTSTVQTTPVSTRTTFRSRKWETTLIFIVFPRLLSGRRVQPLTI